MRGSLGTSRWVQTLVTTGCLGGTARKIRKTMYKKDKHEVKKIKEIWGTLDKGSLNNDMERDT